MDEIWDLSTRFEMGLSAWLGEVNREGAKAQRLFEKIGE
jgi:hypothetical protein